MTQYILFTETDCEHCDAAKEKYKDDIAKGVIVVKELTKFTEEYNFWTTQGGIEGFPLLISMTTDERFKFTSMCVIDINTGKPESCVPLEHADNQGQNKDDTKIVFDENNTNEAEYLKGIDPGEYIDTTGMSEEEIREFKMFVKREELSKEADGDAK